MDKIPCEIIRDLIPLVADHAASKESEKLVQEHIAECGSCRALLQYEPQPEAVPVVARTLKKLRRRLFWTVCAVLVIGIVSGAAMMDHYTMFYNFILFPAVGASAYFLLKKWCWVAPAATFTAVFLRYLFAPGKINWTDGAINGILYGIICALFIGIGLLIGFLLHFAFKKERNSP